MTRHSLRTSILLVALLVPSATAGQSIICSTEVSERDTYALRFFAGTYGIPGGGQEGGPVATDGSNYSVLDGLQSLRIPSEIGRDLNSGSGMHDKHGNVTYYGAHAVRASFRSPSYDPGITRDHDLFNARTAHWCTNTDRGGFYIRAGFQRDLRWEADWSEILLPGGDNKNYLGVKVHPTLLPRRSGLPVQSYRVTDWGKALQHADAFYIRGDLKKAMIFSTFDLEAWGAIRRHEYRCMRLDQYGQPVRDKDGNIIYDTCVVYVKQISGRIIRRIYQDARVLPPGSAFNVGGAEYDLGFRPSATSFQYRLADGQRDSYGERVEEFCGSRWGCGSAPSFVGPGGRHIPGDDDEDRFEQICRRENQDRGCMDRSNQLIVNTDLTSDQIARMLAERFQTGGLATDAQRDAIRSGRRTGGVELASELERICRKLITEDSARIANRPKPANPLDAVATPVLSSNIPSNCQPFVRTPPR
jgi:hypothetical protein